MRDQVLWKGEECSRQVQCPEVECTWRARGHHRDPSGLAGQGWREEVKRELLEEA